MIRFLAISTVFIIAGGIEARDQLIQVPSNEDVISMTPASSAYKDETGGNKKVKTSSSSSDQLIVSKNEKGLSSSNKKILEAIQPAATSPIDINPSGVLMSSSDVSPSRTAYSHPAASSYWHHYNHHVNPNGHDIPYGYHPTHGSSFSPHDDHHENSHFAHHFDPHPSNHYHSPGESHYYHERRPMEISKSGYQVVAPNFISWNYRN